MYSQITEVVTHSICLNVKLLRGHSFHFVQQLDFVKLASKRIAFL